MRPVFTYQTRLALTPEQDAVLSSYAELYGRAQRSLFAALQAGGRLSEIKRAFLPRFGITARQINALCAEPNGKIASIKKRRPGLVAEAKARIESHYQTHGNSSRLKQATPEKRRLMMLVARCAAMEADERAGVVRLCFGGRKLFRAQFHLEANGYASHEEAGLAGCTKLPDLRDGSRGETAGNQSCQASRMEDGSLSLVLRLPNTLAQTGKSR